MTIASARREIGDLVKEHSVSGMDTIMGAVAGAAKGNKWLTREYLHKLLDSAIDREELWDDQMLKCTKCGEKFCGEEVSEWRAEHEEFSMHPFICPDCWDNLQRKDLEDQFEDLMKVKG